MVSGTDDGRMLGALLRIPFQAIVARIHAGLQARGYDDLRPAHFVVFQLLPPEGARVTELAEKAQITKQSMGELVHHLDDCGYLERVVDPTDHRAKVVRRTERGVELDKAAREILGQIEAEWTERLGSDRMTSLRQTLRDLIELMEPAA